MLKSVEGGKDNMYSYQPLRDLLDSRGLSVKGLMREVGFSTNVAVALNNDKSVRIEILADICNCLNVEINQIICIQKK